MIEKCSTTVVVNSPQAVRKLSLLVQVKPHNVVKPAAKKYHSSSAEDARLTKARRAWDPWYDIELPISNMPLSPWPADCTKLGWPGWQFLEHIPGLQPGDRVRVAGVFWDELLGEDDFWLEFIVRRPVSVCIEPANREAGKKQGFDDVEEEEEEDDFDDI